MPTLACTLCEAENGVLMDTNLDSGDTTIVGPACLPGFALSLAGAVTQGMPAEAGDAYGALFDAIAANDPRPPARAAKAPVKPRGKTAASQVSEPLPDGPDSAAGAPLIGVDADATADPAAPPLVSVLLLEPCGECGSTEGIGETDKVVCAVCGALIATRDDLAQ